MSTKPPLSNAVLHASLLRPTEDPLDNFSKVSDENLLRVISSARVGVPGVLTSIKTKYLKNKRFEEIRKPSQDIVDTPEKKGLQRSASQDFSPRSNITKTSTFMEKALDKCKFMNNVFAGREKKDLGSAENFLAVDLLKYESNSQSRRKRVPTEKDTTATIVAFSTNNFTIQPKYMEKRGSMCVCELWHKKDKQKVAKIYQNSIVDASRMPSIIANKDQAGAFRPDRMLAEKTTSKKINENRLRMRIEHSDGTSALLRQVEETAFNKEPVYLKKAIQSFIDLRQKAIKNLHIKNSIIVPKSVPTSILKKSSCITRFEDKQMEEYQNIDSSLQKFESSRTGTIEKISPLESKEKTETKEGYLDEDVITFTPGEPNTGRDRKETEISDAAFLKNLQEEINLFKLTKIPVTNPKPFDGAHQENIAELQPTRKELYSSTLSRAQSVEPHKLPLTRERTQKSVLIRSRKGSLSNQKENSMQEGRSDFASNIYGNQKSLTYRESNEKLLNIRNSSHIKSGSFVCQSIDKANEIQAICKENSDSHRTIQRTINEVDKLMTLRLRKINRRARTNLDDL